MVRRHIQAPEGRARLATEPLGRQGVLPMGLGQGARWSKFMRCWSVCRWQPGWAMDGTCWDERWGQLGLTQAPKRQPASPQLTGWSVGRCLGAGLCTHGCVRCDLCAWGLQRLVGELGQGHVRINLSPGQCPLVLNALTRHHRALGF